MIGPFTLIYELLKLCGIDLFPEAARCPHCKQKTGETRLGHWRCPKCKGHYSYVKGKNGERQVGRTRMINVACHKCGHVGPIPKFGWGFCEKCNFQFQASESDLAISQVTDEANKLIKRWFK